MFYLISGSDDYLVERRLEKIKKECVRQYPDLEIEVLDGEEISPEELADKLDFMPLFATARLIIIKKAPVWGKGGGRRGRQAEEISEVLMSFLDNQPDSLVVAATAEEIDRTNQLVARVKAKGVLEEINKPGPDEIKSFITAEAGARGMTVEKGALEALAGGAPDFHHIVTLLDRMALLEQKRITVQDLAEDGLGEEDANIFAFVDAVLAGSAPTALSLLHGLLRQGDVAARILATLNRQLMTLAKIKSWSEEGKDSAEITRLLASRRKEFAVRRDIAKAGKLEWQRIKMIFDLILEAEVSMKSGLADERTALEILVLKASTPGAGRAS